MCLLHLWFLETTNKKNKANKAIGYCAPDSILPGGQVAAVTELSESIGYSVSGLVIF